MRHIFLFSAGKGMCFFLIQKFFRVFLLFVLCMWGGEPAGANVFLNANYAKNANERKIYISGNYPYNKFTSFIICENLRHLRHLRAPIISQA
jgi:hypothetical protein